MGISEVLDRFKNESQQIEPQREACSLLASVNLVGPASHHFSSPWKSGINIRENEQQQLNDVLLMRSESIAQSVMVLL